MSEVGNMNVEKEYSHIRCDDFLVFNKFEKFVTAGNDDVLSIIDFRTGNIESSSGGDTYVLDMAKIDQTRFVFCGVGKRSVYAKLVLYDIRLENMTHHQKMKPLRELPRGEDERFLARRIYPRVLKISEDTIMVVSIKGCKYELQKVSLLDGRLQDVFDISDRVDSFYVDMKLKKSNLIPNCMYISGAVSISKTYGKESKNMVYLFDHEKKYCAGTFDLGLEDSKKCCTIEVFSSQSGEEFLALFCEREVFFFNSSSLDSTELCQKHVKKFEIHKNAREIPFTASLCISNQYLTLGSYNQSPPNFTFKEGIITPTAGDFGVFDISNVSSGGHVKEIIPFEKLHDDHISKIRLLDVNEGCGEVRVAVSTSGSSGLKIVMIQGLQFTDSVVVQDLKERISYIFEELEGVEERNMIKIRLNSRCSGSNEVFVCRSFFV